MCSRDEEQTQIAALLCRFPPKKSLGKSTHIALSSSFCRERNQGQAQLRALHKITQQSGARAEAEVSTCDVAARSNQQTVTSFADPATGRGKAEPAAQ